MKPTVELKFHNLVDLFPALEAEELDAMRERIRKNGVLVPVMLWRGQLVDGRHRYNIARELGIEFPTSELVCEEDELLERVLSLNDSRRHLTSSQRAGIAAQAKLVERLYTRGGTPGPAGDEPQGRAIERAAAAAGTSPTTLQRAIKVGDADPELLGRVIKGDVSVMAAAKQVEQGQAAEETHTDALGLPVPQHLRPVFVEVEGFDDLVKQIGAVIDTWKELSDGPAGEFLNRGQQQAVAQLKGLITEVRQARPFTVTPRGAKTQSKWITKRVYELLDEDVRAQHEAKKAAVPA